MKNALIPFVLVFGAFGLGYAFYVRNKSKMTASCQAFKDTWQKTVEVEGSDASESHTETVVTTV